jgi:hypothetical protein
MALDSGSSNPQICTLSNKARELGTSALLKTEFVGLRELLVALRLDTFHTCGAAAAEI